jgi:RND superfamily putative drug exporter
MFDRLGRLVVAHPRWICAAWMALAAVMTAVAPPWQSKSTDDDIRFMPETCPSVRGYQVLEQFFPQDVFASRAVFVIERDGGDLTQNDFDLADRIVSNIGALRRAEPELQINGIVSHRDPVIGGRLISADRRCTLIQVLLATPYMAMQTRGTVDRCEAVARAEASAMGGTAPALFVTGPAGVGRDLVKAGAESLDRTTWATIGLVFVVLLIVYRSPVLALAPLATIGVSTWVALKLLALATCIPGVHLVNISQVFAIVILFGAGTDYCLFLISRYREELKSPATDSESALRRSVRAVGGPLAASAGTVICGLAMMGFAEFAKIRCAGPIIGLALAVGLAASLTLTPALLQLFGRRVFWPQQTSPKITQASYSERLWERVSYWVVRQPGWILLGTLTLLAPLALFGLHVVPSYSPIGDLGPKAESIRGLNAIRRHFTAGETGPITVLLTSDRSWTTPAGRDVIDHLSRGFSQLENVAEVRSLTQPLGEPLAAKSGLASLLNSAVQSAATGHYLSRRNEDGPAQFTTRLDIVLRSDPFEAASADTLAVIETWLSDYLPARSVGFGPVQAESYGMTVHARDLAAVIERDRTRVNALVAVGVFVILLVLVRRIEIALFLLGTVVFSYLATLGATAAFASWWSGKPLGEIEWRVPFFLFTILVAVGEDYNILLVSRALQERKRHGHREGIRRGLARTGGTITACGFIMAGTFGTLMLAELGTLVQIGFALGVGILVDTFVIRPLMVPAFLLLISRDEEPLTIPMRDAA